MSGQGRGYCILRLSGKDDEPVAGYAGRAGRPVKQASPQANRVALLQNLAREVENSLQLIHQRIEILESQAGAKPRRNVL